MHRRFRLGSIEPRRLAEPTLLAVAAVYGAALVLAGAAGLFGIWLGVIVLLSILRYGYAVLRSAAQGRSRLPAPGIETMNPVGEIRLVLHFVFFSSLAWLLADPPVSGESALRTAGAAGLLALVVAFPASAALMALTSSLGAALDPRGIAELIRRLGVARYAAILACGVALVAAFAALRNAGVGALAVPLEIYCVLAAFVVVGTALRDARDVVEIPGEVTPRDERAARDRRVRWQAELDRAYASIRSGLVPQGYRTIRGLVDGAGGGDAVHRWVLERMLSWEDTSHARAFGASYVERLVAARRYGTALELAAHLRDPNGLPTAGTAAGALADYARSIGRPALADELDEAVRGGRPGARAG